MVHSDVFKSQFRDLSIELFHFTIPRIECGLESGLKVALVECEEFVKAMPR